MNIRHKIRLWILFIAMTSIYALQCPTNKKCDCKLHNHMVNINCTMNNNSTLKISTTIKIIEIECIDSSDLLDFDLNMTHLGMYDSMEFNCNLSNNTKLIDIALKLGALAKNVQQLSIKSHKSLILKKHHLDGFENLYYLKITGIEKLKIESSTFDKLKNLGILRLLNNNSLSELPPGIFDKLVALESLDVSMNLSSLPKDIFAKLKNLIDLSLDRNNFKHLPKELLRNNTKLSMTHLYANKRNLTLLDGFFSNLPNLNYLYLMNNGLVTLPEDLFWGSSSLTLITLNNNYLQTLPVKIFRDLTQLKTLELNYNNLKVLPDYIFSNTTKLVILDLSNNHITSISRQLFYGLYSLKELNMKKNHLTIISDHSLKSLKTLEVVNLQNLTLFNPWKNHSSVLQLGIFDHLSTLEILDLNSNNLTNLPNNSFAKMENLTEVLLSENNFTDLPKNLFQNNTKLKKVTVFINRRNLTLPEGCFSNLTKLEVLILRWNGLVTLPEDLFWGSSSLNTIDLNNNYLQSLPVKIFQDLTKLEKLLLHSNNLQVLPNNIFQDLNNLVELDLSNNSFTSISEDINKLQTLKILNIENNHLKNISFYNFYTLRKLEIAYLSNNHLTLSDFFGLESYSIDIKSVSPFYLCHRLKELYLANNNISQIFSDWIKSKKLHKLNLSYNNISSIKAEDLQFQSDNIIVNLTHNKIKHIFLHDAKYMKKEETQSYRTVKILVENNPLNCDCDIYDFLLYHEGKIRDAQSYFQIELENLTCNSPKKLKNVRVDDLLPWQYSRNLTCKIKNTDSIPVCSEKCDCFLKPHNKAFIFDCSNKNLSNVPSDIKEPNSFWISNFTKSIDTILHFNLNFSHNQLTQMPDIKKLGLRSVNELILSHNNLSNISLSGLSKTLKVLKLHSNNLSRIHPDVLKFWKNSNLTYLTLYENPWNCDCDAKDFYDFMLSKAGIITISKVKCHGKNASILEMTWNDFCPFDITMIICISIAVAFLGLIIGTFGLIYYKYQEETKIWLFAHRWCLWFITEEKLDKNKSYDAFVSFSHQDFDFIVDELVPNLETGPTPFKLCLHYRDWLAGEWISDNIARSVENSRRTIVVLSPNFLESVWGRMEFRVAHCQALSDGRARVILILYQDIGPINDLDPDLKAYITMNTYIKWGDPWFWDKLRYALPHQRRISIENQ